MTTARLSIYALTALLSACGVEPEQTAASSNDAVTVERLFSHDGCTVYRFRDGAQHYYTRCSGGEVTTTSQRNEVCGKNCNRIVQESIPTSQMDDRP